MNGISLSWYFLLLMLVYFLNRVLLRFFRAFMLKHRSFLDIPKARSSHREPTVRGAGLVFVSSTLLLWCLLEGFWGSTFLPWMITGGVLVAGIGFLDDYESLPIRERFVVQCCASAIFLSIIQVPDFLELHLGAFAFLWYPLAIFFMVSVINLYNFMDGIDGLLGLHSACVLIFWSTFILFAGGGMSLVVLMCLALLFPLIAFLRDNLHPAKVFMGDGASTFLGYTFACLAVLEIPGVLRTANFFVILFFMMPFLFDASFTVIVRFLKGEPCSQAHCSHIFQRLVRAGYGQRAVAWLYTALTAYNGLIVLALYQSWLKGYLIGIPAIVFPYPFLYVLLIRAEARIEDLPDSSEKALESSSASVFGLH